MPDKQNMFDYTQKRFWEGPVYKFWMLIVVTIFFGIFGGDHFYLRSPITGIAKLLVNVLGLGIWWFYDIIQVLVEKKHILEGGLTAPIIGPLGVGAGMFRDNDPDAKPSRDPLRYLLYLVLVFLPYGFDSFVAGDSNGALAKFMCAMIWWLWPVAFLWQLVSVVKAYIQPKKLFEQGPDRIFPFTFFMNGTGPSVLGPKDIPVRTDGCDPGGVNGIFSSILNGFTSIFTFIPNMILSKIELIFKTLFPGLKLAADAVGLAVTAGAKTAETAASTTGAIIDAARNPAVTATSLVSSGIQQAPTLIEQASQLPGQIGSQLGDFATQEKLKELAIRIPKSLTEPGVPGPAFSVTEAPTIPVTGGPNLSSLTATAAAAGAAAGTAAAMSKQMPLMQGGGLAGGGLAGGGGDLGFSEGDLSTTALFLLFSAVLLGGSYYALKRLNKVPNWFTREKQNDDGRKRNDTPPQPSGL
jgi:hypothetical protein